MIYISLFMYIQGVKIYSHILQTIHCWAATKDLSIWLSVYKVNININININIEKLKLKKMSNPFGPAVWPVIWNMYTNVLLNYI